MDARRRSCALRRAFGSLALPVALATSVARAQPGPSGSPSDTPLPPAEPAAPTRDARSPDADELIDAAMRRSWNEGSTRAFLATTLDVGWTYIRPRASLGYGKPFATWLGIDVNPLISGNGLGAYGGVRLALPRLDLRAGTSYFASFNREYLDPKNSYNRLDLDSTLGESARILTYEVEAELSLPAGPGDLVALGGLWYVTGVPDGRSVFEETLRVIVDPPLVWRARGGYVFRFGSARQHSIGIAVDVLNVPAREDSTTVRAGPVVRIVLSRRVEVRGTFVPTILSPDHIGLVGGDFTELGFRYRWATE
jgi:hypothetical protein